MKYFNYFLLLFLTILLLTDCKKNENPEPPGDPFTPTPYEINIPLGFPDLYIAEDNPLTVEGVQLGRMLYYDSILDINGSRACASCHFQEESFSLASVNSLAHVNLGWNGVYLWNGKIEGTLEDIMLFEVEKFFKTDLSKLNTHKTYPGLFKKAFDVDVITSKEAAYALAQFERTLISGNSKWDRYLRGEASLTQAEAQGFEVFFTEKGDCFHCHGTVLFTDNLFHNNGLDSIPEQGRAKITNDPIDVGKFKSPTLRNIMLTAPYMHNGRFATIEEVINFYSEGILWSPTIDPLMKKVSQGGVQLTQQEKNNLIEFLKTLTDTTFTTNPELSNPFLN
ncbi:MAG: hypothetical protein L3J31_06995 [Bacteroidales bacterium]|nr:hypothetical protein [Bacteroidales bacterium]